MRFFIIACIVFGIYQFWYHPTSFNNIFNFGAKETTVDDLGYMLRQQSGKKVVLIFSSDFRNCVCQGAVPAIDATNFPADVTRYIVSVDHDKSALDHYRKYFTNPNVTWRWLGKSCTDAACSNLQNALTQIGVHYNGQLPYVEIFDNSTSRGYAQSPAAEDTACIMSNTCVYSCNGNRCIVKR